MDKVPSQTTCCSLENPITDCRGTLGNAPPGNLSPSARTRDRTSSSLTTSLPHSASLSFTLTDLVSLSSTLLSPLSVFVSPLPHLSLLFSSCLVLPILSSHRPPPRFLLHEHVLNPFSFFPFFPSCPHPSTLSQEEK